MSEFTALIVDDERSNREFLTVILEDFCPEIRVVGQADSVKMGLEQLEEHDPDILFLDVKMPNGDGFQLLEQVEKPRFQLIFTTAYDQYAIRSFKYSAVDYLLKPVDPEDMVRAVNRAKERLSKGELNVQLEALLENLRQQGSGPRKLIVPDQHGFVVIRVEEVIRVEAEGNYSTIVLTSRKEILASKPIKYFEKLLEGKEFARIHNKYLVNLDHVVKYLRRRRPVVVTSDGMELEVSRRKKEEFLKRLIGQ
ncbi:MAG: LytTR family DNA-binding domain-containing protein [Bacteroidota bacterium]